MMFVEPRPSRGNKFSDHTGERFGRLIAVRPLKSIARPKPMFWECVCDCGTSTIVEACHLRSGGTKSCGCLSRDNSTTHGYAGTRIYRVWMSMRNRCDEPSCAGYQYYGGRGIAYDVRWRKFEAFLEDMGEGAKGLQLDRIDSNGGYCKANCRWVTSSVNLKNRRPQRRKPRAFSGFALAAALGLALAGCASLPVPPPLAEVRTVEVRVPVPVPCVSAHEVPTVPRTAFKPGGDMKQNAAAADLDLRELEDYAVKADAVLRQCVGGKL